MTDAPGSDSAAPSIEDLLRQSRWIETLARRLVGDASMADDVSQAAWVIALRERESARSNVRAWLGAIVRNLAREARRREAQRHAVERRGARLEALPSTDELAARVEAQHAVVRTILELDEVDRRTLLLRYFEDSSPEEIARREGVAVQTVHNRVTRAQARLRERLGRDPQRSWLSALAPIVATSDGALRSTTTTGGIAAALLMSTTTKILGAAALLLVLVLLLRTRDDEQHAIALTREATAAAADAGFASANRAESERTPAPVDAPTPTATPTVDAPAVPATRASAAANPDGSATGRVHGIVYRPNGDVAPRRRVRILFCPLPGQKGEKEIVVHTDELGRFSRDRLRAGVWSVATWPDEAEVTAFGESADDTMGGMAFLRERAIEIRPDSDVELLLGAPSPDAVRITGKVTRAGTPAGRLVMQWFPPGEDSISREFIAIQRGPGSYEVTVDGPGTYLVTAIDSGVGDFHSDFVVRVPTSPTFTRDFELEDRVVRGRVVDVDGKPVAEANVDLVPVRVQRRPSHLFLLNLRKSTDAEGRFEFTGLPEGSFRLALDAAKVCDPAGQRVVNSAPADTAPRVEIVQRSGTGIPVRIVGTDGQPTGAYVFVFDERGEPVNGASGRCFKDDAGTVRTCAVPPGRWSVVAGVGFRWSQPRDVAVVEGRPLEPVELRLEDGAFLEVDATGFEDRWIDVFDEAGRRMTWLDDHTNFNRAVFRDWSPERGVWRLPAGNYRVEARDLAGNVVARGQGGVLAGLRTTVKLRP